MKRLLILIISLSFVPVLQAQESRSVPKPLFGDPMQDGAADPVVVYNKEKKEWWMLYTNRRAHDSDTTGVEWGHGTRIGIARSKDGGATWAYFDTADIRYRPDNGYTFWAPEVIRHKNRYHLYLTYVPGIFSDWNHPREIIHLTSRDLLHWDYQSTLSLANKKVIDACVFPLPKGGWRMWYNNEKDGKSIYYADSKDLYTWTDKGKAIAARGEGPKVFRWKGQYRMIVDVWKGMEIYSSDDLLNWTKQANRILEEPGIGMDDQAIGGHCDVVVHGEKAYIFYFTHPGRTKTNRAAPGTVAERRSVIQLAELEYRDGVITCDRDQPVFINLNK